MPTASFEDLCAGFCELAQVPSPELSPDADGLTAFHVELRGIGVDVMYVPAKSREFAFLVFDLGPVHGRSRDAGAITQALLHANYMPLQPFPPTFACNPADGHAVLQCVFPILDGTPAGLVSVIDEGVRLGQAWRTHFFLTLKEQP